MDYEKNEHLGGSIRHGRIALHCLAGRERTQAGLASARARGRLGGRPKALDADKRQLAVQLYHEKKLTVAKICEMMGISKPTLYTYVRAARA